MASRVFACVLALCAVFVTGPALAQDVEPGEILITVTDVATKAPLDDAEVFLLGGDSPVSSLTDEKGQLTFQDQPTGIYAITVQRDGYDEVAINDVDVQEGQRVKINVAMTKSLKTIAVVTSHHADVSISTKTIDDNSAERKVSESLKSALGLLGGVSVDDTTYGPSSAFSIALRNHDASQTGISINGVTIAGPAASMLGGASSLFSGASVSFAPTAGSIGGTINFSTIRPTKLWTYDVSNSIGNFGAQTESISVTGSKHKLSIGVQRAYTSRDSFLSGAIYEDQSGQTYLHEAANRSGADLLRVNYAASQRISFFVTGIQSDGTYSSICNSFTTLVKCGYGPTQPSTGNFDYGQIGGNALVGNVAFNVSAGGNWGDSLYADPGRSLGGAVNPYNSIDRFYSSYDYGSASITVKRHSYSFAAGSSSFGSDTSVTYDGVPSANTLPRQYQSSMSLSDVVKSNDKLALTHAASFASATGAGTAFVLSESATWKPAATDVFQGSIGVGSAQPRYVGVEPVGDPLSAQYDCYNGSVFVDGPADPAVRQSQTSYNASWLHTFRGGSINLSLWRQNAFGQPLTASVPIAADPSDIFPGGTAAYLNAIQSVWSNPAVCGSIPFSPDRTYVIQSISGLGQANQGSTISGRIPLGKNIIALPNYTVGSTSLSSLDPRLATPGSFYAIGEQLPHEPLRTAGLTIDGLLTHSRLEWLGNAQFTGINNANNLPAFTIYSAGLVFKSDHGTLSLIENNLFGTQSGLFTTYQGVNPMPVVGGGSFAYATTPMPPRQWVFIWRIPWTQRVPPPPKKPAPSAAPAPTPAH